MNKKYIVICGSITFLSKMKQIQSLFDKNGIPSIIPKENFEITSKMNTSQYMEFKRRVSRNYFKKISENSVYAILVVNETKKDIKNYIGANTFAEITIAFEWERKIYLLNDIYDAQFDELTAWEAIPLMGNIKKLIFEYHETNIMENDSSTLEFAKRHTTKNISID